MYISNVNINIVPSTIMNRCATGILLDKFTRFPENNTLNPKNNAPMLALMKSCLEKCSGV